VIGKFKLGVSSFFEGTKLLKNDKNLRLLGIIPALMSLTLYTVALVISSLYIDDIMSWSIRANMNDYNLYLKSLIYILSFLLLGFILYFVTFFIVSILSIPVCATLSQKVLIQSGYKSPTQKSFKENIFTFVSMARVSILKLGFLIVISAMLFVASFIPVIAPVAVYLSLILLTLDCMDYSMEQDEMNLKQRFQFMFDHWIEFSGFALCMAIILAIPFIHFILLPSAVLGTSVLYTRLQMTKQGNI
jgi:CysZ protein